MRSNQLSYEPRSQKKGIPQRVEPSKSNSTQKAVSSVDTDLRFTDVSHPFLLRKEVIQPHLPIRLPCYDFTLIICPTLGGALNKVKLPTSGVTNSHGVTGGVYKARERIHCSMLTCNY